MGFLEQNEIMVVARKKYVQLSTAGGGKTAGIPLHNSEIVWETWISLRVRWQVVDRL